MECDGIEYGGFPVNYSILHLVNRRRPFPAATAPPVVLGCRARLSARNPQPHRQIDAADRHYKWEKVSACSRDYLRAATDNLGFWADLVAPFDFEPGAINNVGYRPYMFLGRSGLEAAAHALWVLSAKDVDECVSRHVRLMHRDFRYHVKAIESGGQDAARIKQRITDLEARCEGLDPPPNAKEQPPGYEDLVKLAAQYCEQDERLWAYYRNAASGASHGQNWFSIEGFEIAFKEEYEPGHYRTTTIPTLSSSLQQSEQRQKPCSTPPAVPLEAQAVCAPDGLGLLRTMLGRRLEVGGSTPDGRIEIVIRGRNEHALAGELAWLTDWLEVTCPRGVRDHLASIGGALMAR